jgi:hypothetical protein
VSKPKRYSIRGFSAAMVEEDNGVMVKYADYADLQAENERLTDYLDSIDLAIGKADYEQALDILIEWRKERGDLP